jgi:transposase-like protein
MDMYQFNQIPSEAKIRACFRHLIFGKNIYCPVCKTSHVYSTGTRYRCRRCRKRFSLLSHTWLSNMKIPYQQFWMILWCWTIQIPIQQTMKMTHLSEPTIRSWFAVFRKQLPSEYDTLEHLVQLDEAYFGGKKGRTLFMGKQVGTKKLAYQILSHTAPAREHAWYFLQTYINPQTVVNTDGAGIYRGMTNWWAISHNRDIHKKFEFAHTSEIEGVFGVLRTFIRRMYHHCTVDKLPELVCEFSWRFSHPEIFNSPRSYLEKTLRMVPTA